LTDLLEKFVKFIWGIWGNLKKINCHNPGCAQDRVVIFDSGVIPSDKFRHDQPPLPWQQNLGQNRL